MVILKHKNVKKYGIIILVLVGFLGFLMNTTAEAYICKEGDIKCEEAKKNMQDNQNAANSYSKKADSVGAIIEQLNDEISGLNTMIKENEDKIKQLNKEIEITEKKLEDEQSALAELLVNMHLNLTQNRFGYLRVQLLFRI